MSNTLPTPPPFAKQQSAELVKQIYQEIDNKGPMSFARFMHLALFAPGYGYYSNGSQKFGADGDFITAPEVSPLFSHCLARQCSPILDNLKGDILELGAGSGIMALEILRELERLQKLPEHYYILEVSSELQARQKNLILTEVPHLSERILWLNQLPQNFKGIIVANEVIDALPVHKFLQDESTIKEFCVTHNETQLAWHLQEAYAELKANIAALNVNLDSGYTTEINLWLRPWLTSLAECLEQGLILLIDYGFPRHEYYHMDRYMGTLMCHYRHHSHANPFWFPGLQDITAHVDFTLVAEVAVANQLTVAGFTNQAAFLINCGLLEMITPHPALSPEYRGEGKPDLDEIARHRLNQQIKMLTLPSEMGELFKVMALTKHYEEPLLGFTMMNQLARL